MVDINKTPPPVKKLYATMTYSDNNSATIIGFHPINPDGTPDVERDTFFRGQANLLAVANGQTNVVPMNFDFPPEVTSLQQAVMSWQTLLDSAITDMKEKMQSQRIRQTLLDASGKSM